jgi:hypothetical protein
MLLLAVALTLGLTVSVKAQVPAQPRFPSLGSQLENAFRPQLVQEFRRIASAEPRGDLALMTRIDLLP